MLLRDDIVSGDDGEGTAGQHGLVFGDLAKSTQKMCVAAEICDEEPRDEGACHSDASYKTTGIGGSRHLL